MTNGIKQTFIHYWTNCTKLQSLPRHTYRLIKFLGILRTASFALHPRKVLFHMDQLPAGTKVRISRGDQNQFHRYGTWPRYEGRVGVIVTVHKDEFHDGSEYIEYGVNFGTGNWKNLRAEAWFRPREVVPISKAMQVSISLGGSPKDS